MDQPGKGGLPSRLAGLLVSAFDFLWLAVAYLPPACLTLYGVWLGLKANVVWGLTIGAVFPLAYVVAWTEILLGWDWMSPLWPFAYAGAWYTAALTIQAAAGFVWTSWNRVRRR